MDRHVTELPLSISQRTRRLTQAKSRQISVVEIVEQEHGGTTGLVTAQARSVILRASDNARPWTSTACE